MGNFKTVKKGSAVAMAVITTVVLVCVSVFCQVFASADTDNEKIYLDNAKSSVDDYTNSYNYNSFEFMDNLFAKANVIAASVTEKTTEDTAVSLVKNLGINSFVITDGEGKIIASSESDKVGKNMLDDDKTKQFKPNLKGIKVKSISDPEEIKDENGVYNLMACVAGNNGGVVIIDTDTDEYAAVVGADIAKGCKGDTVIANDDEIISTNLKTDAKTLKDLGITESMIKSGSFTAEIDGTTYSFDSMQSGEYTIISGTSSVQGGFNIVYGIVIPCAAGVVMLVATFIVLNICTVKKKENE